MSLVQKTYKKGESLFKEGEKIQTLVFIQSGGVAQCLQRGKKNIELFQFGANQVLGEGALIGQTTHTTSAIATAETKTIEIAPDNLKELVDGSNLSVKTLVRSLVERIKMANNEIKSVRLSGDSTPCAPEYVPQVYASIYYTALHKGVKSTKPDQATGLHRVSVDWTMMRTYGQRVFGQSPKRIEQALNILVKLKLAEYVMGKLPDDPKGPDVILEVTLFEIGPIEGFFEFFQYYHYKPGKGDIIKYDDFCCQMVEVFVAEGTKVPMDSRGLVRVEFSVLASQLKEKMGTSLNNDHFSRLENKGVLCKRKTADSGGVIVEFEIKELRYILFSWKIINEIDKWNEKGFVDPTEKEERKAKKGGPTCQQCAADIAATAKFCPECGAKVSAAAA